MIRYLIVGRLLGEPRQKKGEVQVTLTQIQKTKGFGKWWVVASGLGLFIGFIIYFALVVGVSEDMNIFVRIIIAAVAGAFFGTSIGFGQRFVLQRYDEGLQNWLRFSIWGAIPGGILALLFGEFTSNVSSFNAAVVASGAVLGASIGIGQWLVLRQHFSRSGWWIPTCCAGVTIGTGLSFLLTNYFREFLADSDAGWIRLIIALLIFGIFIFAGFGASTRIVLAWLRQQAVVE